MMTIQQMTQHITERLHFKTIQEYEDFAMAFLDFVEGGLQAKIVCQNEVNYQFFQYKEDCGFNISRPINSDLFGTAESFGESLKTFNVTLKELKKRQMPGENTRSVFNSVVYTLQQCIGVALDALPASSANQAKKINGDLFERLIRLLMTGIGVNCSAGVLQVPVKDEDGHVVHQINYQHDLIGKKDGQIKFIGSVKTSSKDRIDKIFVDKLLYSRFTGTSTPYIAVFLNDVQRAKSKTFGKQKVNSTFLSGHFKAYTLKLTPMDGVFYCDLRPNMKSDPFLCERIHGIDCLFYDEIPKFGV